MIVAMACNKEWYKYLVVDLYSLLETTKRVKKIYLIVETENIDEIPYLRKIKEKYNVEFVLIDFNYYIEKHLSEYSPNRDNEYSNFTFGRLMLPSLIKEDKVVYIDTDAIVRKDISHVWDYDLSEYYLAGVKDWGILERGNLKELRIKDKYINAGFAVFNLEKIRKDKIQKKWFNIINKRELLFPDQDAINMVCSKKELYLPSIYNVCWDVTLEVMNRSLAKVFHYAGPKENWVVDHFFSEEWYDAEEKFYNEFGYDE